MKQYKGFDFEARLRERIRQKLDAHSLSVGCDDDTNIAIAAYGEIMEEYGQEIIDFYASTANELHGRVVPDE